MAAALPGGAKNRKAWRLAYMPFLSARFSSHAPHKERRYRIAFWLPARARGR